ncbi:MAG: polysaccharide deacetylase family protein [Clostridiales bacterium]|nr:polysaccharide deacetylase family protein [Clostridiales bacterium]
MEDVSKLVALTFDDGPAVTTLPIIEALESFGAAATFFVNGMHLIKYPETAARASRAGFEIGNHTNWHLHLAEQGYDEILAQITATTELIVSITGKEPTIMRPPYGEYSDAVKLAARNCGLALVNWSIDPMDWDTDDAAVTRERILSELKDGAVVLCHDRMQCEAELMPFFIPELQKLGYKLVTVSELFEAKGVKLEPGVLYLSPNDEPER